MGFLRKVPGDMTYNQLGSLSHLPKSGPYYSMDLSSATDRFPVELQRAVLAQLVDSEEYADAWKRIMIQEKFANPWGQPVAYAAGQPMGAYSSWAMFALCHHLVVRTAAKRAGYDPVSFNKYVLLGDDIVIADRLVSEKYQELMESMGVQLSLMKTHVSDDTYEFAKRWYQAGNEISGIQLRAFMDISNWSETAEVLRTSVSRWSLSPLDMEPQSIRSLLWTLGLRVRDYHKVVSLLHLPIKEDSEEIRGSKSEWLAIRFFKEVFGCHPRPTIKGIFILQSLAEVKAALIETGIKSVFMKGQKFLSELQQDPDLGLVDQSVLLNIPTVSAVRSELIELQTSFEKLRSAYYDLDEDIVLGRVALSMSDPSRIMTKSARKMIVGSQASIVNKYKAWSKDYQATRVHLLSDSSSPTDDVS